MLSICIAHTLSKDSPLPEMCYTAVHCYPSSVTQTLMMCPNFSQCPVWRPFPPWDARHFATHWTLENSLTYTDLRMSVHLLLIPTCTTKCKSPKCRHAFLPFFFPSETFSIQEKQSTWLGTLATFVRLNSQPARSKLNRNLTLQTHLLNYSPGCLGT